MGFDVLSRLSADRRVNKDPRDDFGSVWRLTSGHSETGALGALLESAERPVAAIQLHTNF